MHLAGADLEVQLGRDPAHRRLHVGQLSAIVGTEFHGLTDPHPMRTGLGHVNHDHETAGLDEAEQRRIRLRIAQHHEPALFPPVGPQGLDGGRGEIVARAGDDHRAGIGRHGPGHRQIERRDAHALARDVFLEEGEGRTLADRRFAVALQEIDGPFLRRGEFEQGAGQQLLAFERGDARRVAGDLRQIVVFGHVHRGDLLGASAGFDNDEIFLGPELVERLQFAGPGEVAHRVHVFDGDAAAVGRLVFFEQVDHVAVDLETRRGRGGGKEDVDVDRRGEVAQEALGLFAQAVFLARRPVAPEVVVEAGVVGRAEQDEGQHDLHGDPETDAGPAARGFLGRFHGRFSSTSGATGKRGR